jgi:riboflavin kinase/FMN adenylyltransferase
VIVTTPPAIVGTVVHGDGRGRTLGYPTANLALEGAALPADGIYAALARIDDEPRRWQASVSVGTNPTFAGARERRVEVHLHDVDLDLYDRRLTVDLVAYLRPTRRFRGTAALVAQTADDIAACRALLAAPPLVSERSD